VYKSKKPLERAAESVNVIYIKNCIFLKKLAIIVEKFGTKNIKNCIFLKKLAIIVEKFLNNFFQISQQFLPTLIVSASLSKTMC